MKFTKEKPTEPGYYWVKMYNKLTIIKIDSIFWLDFIGSDETDRLNSKWTSNNVLWGDKIELPEAE